MRRHLLGILIAILAFTSMLYVYHTSRHGAGAVEAYVDLFRGKYIVKASGRLAAEKDEYNAVLKEFGAAIVVVGDCTITEELDEEILGYNAVSVSSIDDKSGKTIWDRLEHRFGRP